MLTICCPRDDTEDSVYVGDMEEVSRTAEGLLGHDYEVLMRIASAVFLDFVGFLKYIDGVTFLSSSARRHSPKVSTILLRLFPLQFFSKPIQIFSTRGRICGRIKERFFGPSTGRGSKK
jgi:hypothetical protein